MTVALKTIESLLQEISALEKVQILDWVMKDLGDVFPGIEKTPNVCGGEACVIRTRIPVWLLVRQRQLGISDTDILSDYPSLRAVDLLSVWHYYQTHKEEIEKLIVENEQA